MNLKPEQSVQVQLFDWIKRKPAIRRHIFYIPNEMKVSMYHGVILKRMGRRQGVSDVFVAIPKRGYHGMFLELKAGQNKPTNPQLEFMDDMRAQNYFCEWASTFEKAKGLIQWYLELNPNTY